MQTAIARRRTHILFQPTTALISRARLADTKLLALSRPINLQSCHPFWEARSGRDDIGLLCETQRGMRCRYASVDVRIECDGTSFSHLFPGPSPSSVSRYAHFSASQAPPSRPMCLYSFTTITVPSWDDSALYTVDVRLAAMYFQSSVRGFG